MITDINKLTEVIKSAQKNVFRFESLQDYTAEDGDDLIPEFLKSGDIGWDPAENDFWRMIKDLNSRGIQTERVRMINEPLNDYVKWEVASLKKASEYSLERLYIINKSLVSEIAPNLKNDFYMVDDLVYVLHYQGLHGEWIGFEFLGEDSVENEKYVVSRKLLLDRATLLVNP